MDVIERYGFTLIDSSFNASPASMKMEGGKRIEVCKVRAGDLKADFWNPRKITKKRLEELERSFELLGDFGIFVIDEENRVIVGNQRLKVIGNTA